MEIRRVAFTHRDASALLEQVQAEYTVRYGGPDETPLDPSMFDAPTGAFFVGYLEGRPVAMGGWRLRADVSALGERRAAEIKRMYVAPDARRQGLARLLLRHLEASARDAGAGVMVLETGIEQPEAISLYLSEGYAPVEGFGHYAWSPKSRYYGRLLRASPGDPLPLFDAHLHVIDPRFPLVANQGYLPPAFTVPDYLDRTAHLGIVGGAVVSGSFQAFDSTYLVDALERLGPTFVGVAQLPATVSEEEVARLDRAGVRAARVNVRRGGSETVGAVADLAALVSSVAGWHVEVYVDSRELPELAPVLGRLPQVVIDHLGLSAEGFADLLHLVERGAHVKATGFGRVDLDIPAALRAIAAVNPEALLVGTDLPSTRAPRPFRDEDLALARDALEPAAARAAFLDNAVRLYRPGRVPVQAPERPRRT